MGSGTDGISYKTDSDGNPKVFNVNRNNDGKFWLNSNNGQADNKWNANNQWVFVCRKSLES